MCSLFLQCYKRPSLGLFPRFQIAKMRGYPMDITFWQDLLEPLTDQDSCRFECVSQVFRRAVYSRKRVLRWTRNIADTYQMRELIIGKCYPKFLHYMEKFVVEEDEISNEICRIVPAIVPFVKSVLLDFTNYSSASFLFSTAMTERSRCKPVSFRYVGGYWDNDLNIRRANARKVLMQRLLKSIPYVKTLQFWPMILFDDPTIRFEELTRFYIIYSKENALLWEDVLKTKLPNLKELIIEWKDKIEPTDVHCVFGTISVCEKLEYLRIYIHNNLTEVDYSKHCVYDSISIEWNKLNHTRLRKLSIRFPEFHQKVPLDNLYALLTNVISLRELHFETLMSSLPIKIHATCLEKLFIKFLDRELVIIQSDIISLFAHGHSVKSVHLIKIPSVTQALLDNLMRLFQNLQELHIVGGDTFTYNKLTDHRLDHFVQHIQTLQVLVFKDKWAKFPFKQTLKTFIKRASENPNLLYTFCVNLCSYSVGGEFFNIVEQLELKNLRIY